jgi:hypothetical protein
MTARVSEAVTGKPPKNLQQRLRSKTHKLAIGIDAEIRARQNLWR